MKQPLFLFSVWLTLMSSCQSSDQNQKVQEVPVQDTVEQQAYNTTAYPSEQIDYSKILINGHSYKISQKDFDQQYPALDSSIVYPWECGDPFFTEDFEYLEKNYGPYDNEVGTFAKEYDVKTFFTQGLEFISDGNKVIFQQANKHIIFEIPEYHIRITEQTTEEEFKKLFPKMTASNSGDELIYSLMTDQQMESSFYFIFKKGKLYSINLWWLLC